MEHRVEVGGSVIRVVEVPSDRRLPFATAVMLHGFPLEHHHMLATFEPAFTARPGWRRLYVDLPGTGGSSAGSEIDGTDAVFAALVEVLGSVLGDGAAAVCGHSWGARLALGLVATEPDRWARMCLVVPDLGADGPQELPTHTVLHQDRSLVEALDPEVAQDFRDWAVVIDERVVSRVLGEIDGYMATADQAAIARIQQGWGSMFPVIPARPHPGPSLFVHGRQDSRAGYTAAWSLLDHFPRASFVVLDRAGHYLPIEQDVLFTSLVEDWLDRVAELIE